MNMRGTWVILAAMLLAFVPSGEARSGPTEPTPTTLYFHMFDTFNKFPINTQGMNESFFEVGGTNFPSVDVEELGEQNPNYDFNTIYGYSTAGPVEYDFIENGRPRFHPERGIAETVKIDEGVQPMVYLYLDVRDITGVDRLPNLLPSFTFEVTMRTGDDVGRDANLDAGDPIMHGDLTAFVWDGADHLGEATNGQMPESIGDTPILVPDATGVVEFAIPMTIDDPEIPKEDAYNIRIDWYQNPTGDDAYDDRFAEGYLRLVANAAHLPRLEMSVTNPVYIDFIHPQVAAGILLIHTGVNSPWGTYDVDVDDIKLTVTGPTTPQNLQQVVAQNAHVHGLHDKSAEVTYLWRFRDEKAPDGEYTITMEVPNLVGNAVATESAKFFVEGKKAYGEDEGGNIVEPTDTGGGGKDSPGAGALALVAALGAAGLTLRRRS